MAFGAVRAPYSAACKFYADDNGFDNRINWYIVPDDTPYYEGETPFWPRVLVPADKASTYREREGAGRVVRLFDHGVAFLPPAPPHGVHGDEQDFLGQSPRSKFWIEDVAPEAPCDVFRVYLGGIRMGAKIRPAPRERNSGVMFGALLVRVARVQTSGLAFGATPLTRLLVHTLGLRFGAEIIIPAPSLVFTAGMRFGGQVVEDVPVARAGLRFGAELIDPHPVETAGLLMGATPIELAPSTLTAGLLLGADVPAVALPSAGLLFGADAPPLVPVLTAGLELGAGMLSELASEDAGILFGADPVAELIIESAGVELGAQAVEGDAERTLDAGLLFGADPIGDAEDLGDDGLSCTDPPELFLDTWYSFDATDGPRFLSWTSEALHYHTYEVQIILDAGSCMWGVFEFLNLCDDDVGFDPARMVSSDSMTLYSITIDLTVGDGFACRIEPDAFVGSILVRAREIT